MIAYNQVFISLFDTSFGHFFNCIQSVAPVTMTVNNTFDIRKLYKGWDQCRPGFFNCLRVFTERGWNKMNAGLVKNIFF